MKKRIRIIVSMACFISITGIQASDAKKKIQASTNQPKSIEAKIESDLNKLNQDMRAWLLKTAKNFRLARTLPASDSFMERADDIADLLSEAKIKNKKLESRIKHTQNITDELDLFHSFRNGDKNIEDSMLISALESKKISILEYIKIATARDELFALRYTPSCSEKLKKLKTIESDLTLRGVSYQGPVHKAFIADVKKKCSNKK